MKVTQLANIVFLLFSLHCMTLYFHFLFTLHKSSSKIAMTWQRRWNHERISSLSFLWCNWVHSLGEESFRGNFFIEIVSLQMWSSKRLQGACIFMLFSMIWAVREWNYHAVHGIQRLTGELNQAREQGCSRSGTTVGESELIEWIWRLCCLLFPQMSYRVIFSKMLPACA